MARSSATAAFLLLLSLLAIAHCRTLQSEPATETTTVAVGDETGPPPTDVLTEAGATEVVPAEQDGFLRRPSHRRHRHPCRHGLFHRHLWWARHHGTFGHGHRFPHRGDVELVRDGEPRVAAEDEEVKLVAEPYPDRSFPNSDGGDGDDAAAVKGWRKEMLWRMFRHGLRHHRHHHHHHEEEDHEREDGGVTGLKRFRHHDDEEEDDEEKQEKMRKLFHFHHHHHEDEEEKMRKPFHHADDSDEDDNELEEMVRRFRKAILRRRFHHHGRFFRHHHRHAEEAAEQSGGEQQQERGGVMNWVKGLIMNRF